MKYISYIKLIKYIKYIKGVSSIKIHQAYVMYYGSNISTSIVSTACISTITSTGGIVPSRKAGNDLATLSEVVADLGN